jgi:hypothetical protein
MSQKRTQKKGQFELAGLGKLIEKQFNHVLISTLGSKIGLEIHKKQTEQEQEQSKL